MEASHEAAIEMDGQEQTQDLETVFREQYPRIARTIAGIIRDPARAEELAVEVFLRWSKGREAKVTGWLYRTAVRLGLDELRRQTRRGRFESVVQILRPPRTPEEIHVARNREDRVGAVLAAMNTRDAELVLLRADGLSYAELAASLGLNPASVGTLLARAQQTFRKEYVKRYGNVE